ncbi:inactive Rho GTPase-activating protein 11B-like [Vanacampus margaritifer]
MNITDSAAARLHLQLIHGINVKNVVRKTKRLLVSGTKVFGVPVQNLSRTFIPEFGLVPCFLVDTCMFLLERAGTVGLFRKPGSLPRIQTLRAKLNGGKGCLSAAFAYDVATLVKQFCRELPEPLIPAEIHMAMLKAQTLDSVQDRTSALQLLSCLLPARNSSCLHYLLDFLSKVAHRCEENLMTSSNLATVFAPCLLPPPNKEELSERRFELRILVLCTFIEKPQLFGVIPPAVMDSMEFLTSCHFLKDAQSKKAKRHSLKVLWCVKTVPQIQAKSKIGPAAPQPNHESNLGRRPTLRRSVGQETLPNITLFRTCVSCEDLSPGAAILDASSQQSSPNRIKRLVQGQEVSSPVFTGVGKLLASWSKRISL